MSIFLLVLLILSGMWLYRRHLEKVYKNFYKSKIENIKFATKKFAKYLEINTAYFTNYQLSLWKSEQTTLFNEIKEKPFEFIHLSIEEVQLIKNFNYYFFNGEKLRNEFNRRFVENELKKYSQFFDNVEGRKLDKQQRTAIVTDEDNNLVIAGAGSGKTTTIVCKVNYVIDRYKVNPNEILLISFTNKSASTLASRIDIEGVEAKTFHKLGKDIIAECEGKQPSIFDENQFRPLLTKYFTDLLKNETYLKKVIDYFTNFLKPIKSQFEFENQGDYIQYLKDKNFQTYKLIEVPIKEKTTYKMEVVKSIEECKIANFLLFNGIDYKYEYPYEFETANKAFGQYKPDFTIFQDGKKVYIEHFGISRNGNVPKWFQSDGILSAKEKYQEGMKWKRETHTVHNTKLIETYSYEMNEDILFDNLTKHLTEIGIILHPKSPKEIWEIIDNAAKDEVKDFTTLFGTFITLMKSNNYSITDVINKNKQIQDAFFRKRNILFIDIIKPIYDKYEHYLSDRGEIDFSDMINKASKYITLSKYKRKFSYVIIDEFQDISIGRYQLVKAIKTINPSCKLFCVGDDWQSIYRFSGSDIALFKDFEKYFGYTVKSKIETTYRFHNQLIKLSSNINLNKNNEGLNIIYIKYKINNESHCGVIRPYYFASNIEIFLEAQNYNTCLNRKISIDSMGLIKNCPSMTQSFG